jgi:hypothetical protein
MGMWGRDAYFEDVGGTITTGQGHRVAGKTQDGYTDDNLNDAQGSEGLLHRHDGVAAAWHVD